MHQNLFFDDDSPIYLIAWIKLLCYISVNWKREEPRHIPTVYFCITISLEMLNE